MVCFAPLRTPYCTEAGLPYQIQPPATQVGWATITLLESGDLDGSSFAFLPSNNGIEWMEQRVKVNGVDVTIYIGNVKAVELFDVGLVTYPAYLGTSTGTRSSRPCLDARSDAEQMREIRTEFEAWK